MPSSFEYLQAGKRLSNYPSHAGQDIAKSMRLSNCRELYEAALRHWGQIIQSPDTELVGAPARQAAQLKQVDGTRTSRSYAFARVLSIIWSQGNDQDLGQRVRFISPLAVRSRDNRHGVPAFERLLAFL